LRSQRSVVFFKHLSNRIALAGVPFHGAPNR
jgi:hypothetical protein